MQILHFHLFVNKGFLLRWDFQCYVLLLKKTRIHAIVAILSFEMRFLAAGLQPAVALEKTFRAEEDVRPISIFFSIFSAGWFILVQHCLFCCFYCCFDQLPLFPKISVLS